LTGDASAAADGVVPEDSGSEETAAEGAGSDGAAVGGEAADSSLETASFEGSLLAASASDGLLFESSASAGPALEGASEDSPPAGASSADAAASPELAEATVGAVEPEATPLADEEAAEGETGAAAGASEAGVVLSPEDHRAPGAGGGGGAYPSRSFAGGRAADGVSISPSLVACCSSIGPPDHRCRRRFGRRALTITVPHQPV
jgi:hypothetical protein